GAISEKKDVLGEVNRYAVTEKTSLIEARMKVGVYSPVSVIKAAIKEADNAEVVFQARTASISSPWYC
ncbi:MAG: hypothetical protein JZU55_11735, partial [Afipia sp.]|nr:hypothetical protein [Afipia sp.]